MDYIKKAINRAKTERRERPLRQRPGTDQRVSPSKLAQIEYQDTRVVKVSTDDLREQRIIAGLDNDPAGTAYKILRTHVLQRMGAQQWTTLAVTSCGMSEGKSLTSANLAVSVARMTSNTVLLMDLDLKRTEVNRLFGYEATHGLSDFLLDGLPLAEIIFNPGIERLVVLPAGRPLPNSSEMLRSPELIELLREVKSRYPDRIVLLDLPPLLMGDDVLAVTPYVDCVLLVIEDDKTHPEDVLRAVSLLRHTNLVGTVLNKCNRIRESTYYY